MSDETTRSNPDMPPEAPLPETPEEAVALADGNSPSNGSSVSVDQPSSSNGSSPSGDDEPGSDAPGASAAAALKAEDEGSNEPAADEPAADEPAAVLASDASDARDEISEPQAGSDGGSDDEGSTSEGSTSNGLQGDAGAAPRFIPAQPGGETLTTSEARGTETSNDEDEPLPTGYVKVGTEELWYPAKGSFEVKDLKGYAPSPESGELRVDISNFDGPLDLLLHLIRQHALDILDIPIATITKAYLSILDDMRELNLDVAGEFLLMAAQLAHIKSKMLLPREETEGDEEPEEDPRLALVRRLLEYQRFQDASGWLAEQEWLGRDIFGRPGGAQAFDPDALPAPDEPSFGLVEIQPIQLIKTLDVILKRSKRKIIHEVVLERLNVGQRINDLVDFARERESFTFIEAIEAFGGIPGGKGNMIVTFLAILEMTKFKLLKLHQAQEDGAIYITTVSENMSDEDHISIDGYGDEAASPGATA